MKTARTSKASRLANALMEGKKMTSRQIARTFQIANPTAHVNYLRERGYRIVSKQNKFAIA